MNRHPRNQGGRQEHQNSRSTRHTRNNALYEDLFATSTHSRAPSEASSDSLLAIATPGRGEPIDAPLPAEIVRRCLSDYTRPVVQRQTMRVNARLQRGTNFKIDSHILGLLPTFHELLFDMWTSSAWCENSTNSTMSPTRWPRCASCPSRLRKGQRSGFSPWAVSLIHGEIWKTHFCVSTTWQVRLVS